MTNRNLADDASNPNATSLADNDAFPVRVGGLLKEALWSLIKSTLYNALGAESILPTGYITRGTIANNAGDANNDIDFAARKCRDSTDAVYISVAALTKRLDANWAVGTNQGGLDTGSKAINTWYHCYAIKRSDTGVTDFIFSANATSPTLPANYDYFKKLAGQSILTDGSGNILPFKDDGDAIHWPAQVTNLSAGTQTTGTATTLTVPPGEKVEALLCAGITAPVGGGAINIYDPDISAASAPPFYFSFAPSSVFAASWGMSKTNTSAQIKYFVTSGGSGYIYTQGWKYRHLQA